MSEGIVIVGGGLAAASAAKGARSAGFDGRITLVAAERHEPYIRPPLSKGYLSGAEGLGAVFVHPSDWYAEQRVEMLLGTSATAIDPAAHTVALSQGLDLRYDALLLATGSAPRRLPIAGADLDGVHYFRTLDDSEALRARIADGGLNVVLIGSGWIGLEVGATARGLGNAVTILERDPIPLANAVGDRIGAVFAELHRAHGVDLRMQVGVDRIVGESGRATGVALGTGEVVPADLVLIGVGAVPNVALAEQAGLAVDNGILVDAALRTSAPDVFAAGDVANAFHPVVGQRLRSEHWANALAGGRAAGRSMAGASVNYDDIPYFYTDQFDLGMEYSGYAPLQKDARLVIRGDLAAREFVAFWLKDERVVAGMNVNVWDVNATVQRLIRSAAPVDAAALADTAVPLESLLPA